jgi:predicted membrane protein
MVQPGKSPEFQLTGQLILGVVIVSIGVLFTLDNLGLLEARDILRYWPIVLLIFGVAQVLYARSTSRGFAGVLWILAGGFLFGRQLGLFDVGVRDLWPLFLVALGGFIVWQAFHRELPAKARGDVWSSNFDVDRPAPPSLDADRAAPPSEPEPVRRPSRSGSTIAGLAVMGEFKRKINVGDFRGGHLTAIMGGCNVDLRGTTPVNGEAVLDVFALMGGIEIRVPDTWDVVNDVFPFMGGIEDKTTRPAGRSGPRLVIRGFVMMGGVTIQN